MTATVTVEGSLNTQCTVFKQGTSKPPAARCNIILLSARVGISLPRPSTLAISTRRFSFLALVFRSIGSVAKLFLPLSSRQAPVKPTKTVEKRSTR